MMLINTDQNALKRIAQKDSNIVYGSLIAYKNNTCIKVYDEEGNPLGDIPEEEVNSYINDEKIVLFLETIIDDDTGLPMYTLETMV